MQVIRALIAGAAVFSISCMAPRPFTPSEMPTTAPAEESNLLILRGQGIIAGFLPNAGGRMVLLRSEAGENWLATRTTDWSIKTPEPTVDTPFSYTLQGAVVWAGPQSAFWTDQDLDATRKAAKDVWPPDPFLEWGRSVVHQTSNSEVQFVLPASPITGLQLTNTYRITGPRRLAMEVVATNARDRDVHHDIWPDVRLLPTTNVRVPIDNENAVRLRIFNGERPQLITTDNGYATWPGVLPTNTPWSGKAFITAKRQEILCDRGGAQLRVYGSLDDFSKIHKEQAAVELFREGGDDPKLEIEMHGPFCTLKPGEQMSFTMTFEITKGPNQRS